MAMTDENGSVNGPSSPMKNYISTPPARKSSDPNKYANMRGNKHLYAGLSQGKLGSKWPLQAWNEVQTMKDDKESLTKELRALSTSNEHLRVNQNETQARLKALEMERDGHLSQIARLGSLLAHSEFERVKLKEQLGVSEEENTAARLAMASLLETEQKMRADMDSLKTAFEERSSLLERERNKALAESGDLRLLLHQGQADLSQSQEEIDGFSLALEKERAEKEALMEEISQLRSKNSDVEQELFSAKGVIFTMQKEESKQLDCVASLRDELAQAVEQRIICMQARINVCEEKIAEVASNAAMELRAARESMEMMRRRLHKASEENTLSRERIALLTEQLSSANKRLKQRSFIVQTAVPTALVSTCSLLGYVLSGIFLHK